MKTNEYDQQAQKFLDDSGIMLTMLTSGNTPPPWYEGPVPCGQRYLVTIEGEKRTISFDFWGSIADREKGKHPSKYDILACLSSEVNCPDDFDEFCAEYGYNNDSRKDYATWERCHEFATRLRAFFTKDEQAALQEIQ